MIITTYSTYHNLKRSLQTADRRVFLEFQESILVEQLASEERFDARQQSYISDRGLDPLAYAGVGVYCSEQAERTLAETRAARALIERYRAVSVSASVSASGSVSVSVSVPEKYVTLVVLVLVHPLSHVQDDGVRLVQNHEAQDAFTQRMHSILTAGAIAIAFVELECTDRNERVRFLELKIQEMVNN